MKNKNYNKIILRIKFIKILIPKQRALSAETLWRRDHALMEINVNLLMDQLSSNATLIIRCHIKLDLAMLSLERDTVHMDQDVTSYIEINSYKSRFNLQ
jgi:hypothetical protein